MFACAWGEGQDGVKGECLEICKAQSNDRNPLRIKKKSGSVQNAQTRRLHLCIENEGVTTLGRNSSAIDDDDDDDIWQMMTSAGDTR